MHDIEPHYNWRGLYISENDPQSPFYGKTYSEFEFQHQIYNYLIHPQWDEFGSSTMYLKILFVDYAEGYAIIELLGEWNDAVNNDIMWLRREVTDVLGMEGIDKFILIGENVLNFHGDDNSYYDDWFGEVEDGWIALINFRPHVLDEFRTIQADYYVNFGGELDELIWRTQSPALLFSYIEKILQRRLNP